MSFGDWLIEAVGEAGVDRALFGFTVPLQRWVLVHVFSPIWGRIRRDFRQEYALFLKMSRKRRAGFVMFLLCTLPTYCRAIALGDSAPYTLQLWVGPWAVHFRCSWMVCDPRLNPLDSTESQTAGLVLKSGNGRVHQNLHL